METILIKIFFWNIDQEYEWDNLYLFQHYPDKKSIKKLYDGFNLPIGYQVIGEVVDSTKMYPKGVVEV